MNGESGTAHSFDGGLTFLICNNFQLDIFVGTGISELADDWTVGTGLSFRLPQ